MPGVFEDGTDAGGEQSLPRFLSSDRSEAVPVILDWAARADEVARYSATAAMAGAALLGSAFMAPEAGQRQAQIAPTVRVMPVRIVMQTANEQPLEDRLTYASRLQDHLSAMKQMPALAAVPQPAEAGTEVGPAELPPGAAGGPDPAAMLLVRNLPESVTFNDGVPAGIGVWAIGGQDAKELVNAIKDGPVAPVIAEVEVITGAGLTIASQTIELPAANTAALSSTVSQAEVETVKAQDVKAEAKPTRRKRQVHARPRVPVVVAEEAEEKPKPKTKRRKKRVDDAYSGPKLKAPSDEDKSEKQEADAGKEQEKQGAIGKFFTWLKGGNKPAGKPQEEPPPSPITGETDGSLRGLGMSPIEK